VLARPPARSLAASSPSLRAGAQPPRGHTEALMPPFTIFRLGMTGLYIGGACVGAFVHSYKREQGIGPRQLLKWGACAQWPASALKGTGAAARGGACALFAEHSDARAKASSMALSVLVVVECVRAFCALSEKQSLLAVRPWANPYLGLGMAAQVLLHSAILYAPNLARVFNVRPLTKADWLVVLAWSLPVVLLDEVLKFAHRRVRPPPPSRATTLA
jgi:Ca2+-transporting ATPase